jgi:hypothetical protein
MQPRENDSREDPAFDSNFVIVIDFQYSECKGIRQNCVGPTAVYTLLYIVRAILPEKAL